MVHVDEGENALIPQYMPNTVYSIIRAQCVRDFATWKEITLVLNKVWEVLPYTMKKLWPPWVMLQSNLATVENWDTPISAAPETLRCESDKEGKGFYSETEASKFYMQGGVEQTLSWGAFACCV